MKQALLAATILATAVGTAAPSWAQTAADLGKTLTAMGAVKAGNADGTIPAYTGGYTTPPAGWKQGDPRLDPFASEKPLFSITAQNVDKYADKLAAGTVAMIRTLPGYHVDVYPTHRTAAAPQYIYDNAIANASRAHLSENGLDVQDAKLSIPFPIPKSGNEAIWNHILRWRSSGIDRTVSNALTTPTGDYTLERWHERILLAYNIPGLDNPAKWDSMFWQEVLEPPRIAGQLTLVISHQDPFEQPREAWTYNPGERRVRRAPEINYDTPVQNTDGLETVDDYDMYNGAIDRFDWKIIGKKEVYVPYNTYKFQDPKYKYSDIVLKDAANPDLIRFELHRVWIVEGTLKQGVRHIYSRRTDYIDEDSWQILIADRYDARGTLWRTSLAMVQEAPEIPIMGADGYEHLDLIQHRYLLQGMHNQEPRAPIYDATVANIKTTDYTAEALRRTGRR
jgi:Protein of unknown function (DUF1329)